MSEIIDTLGTLAAKQKLVPFMGAGCSASMMPDWDTLVHEMAKKLELTSTSNHLEIAQKYVDKFGRDKFCEFLKSKLEISEFDDEKGYIHLTIMNMGVPAIYTTNQDNVMEKGYKKYGKKYRAIIEMKDFAETKLSEQLYIKFHGDLNNPKSIVFTQEDYQARINDQRNALNIRLRADLLAKNLLFIGYSFRDINIQQMFAELQEAFYGQLPPSYMIAYKYSEQLQILCNKYGIILIDPMKECPESENHAVAFETFLRCILEDTRIKKVDDEIKEFFTPTSSNPVKVVNKQELELLERIIKKGSFSTSVKTFREVCDLSNIPLDYEKRIVDAFIELAKSVKEHEDTNDLNAAIFNLKLRNPLNELKVLAALMATANVRVSKSKYGEDNFFISKLRIRNGNYIVLAAKAIENIYSWGWKPTAPLSSNVGHWIDRGVDYKILPEHVQQYVMSWVNKMRKDCKTVAEHPINRQQRIQNYPLDNLTDDEIKLLCDLIR
ncbi:SIR2 family NAD-dependent protein deacylase [Peribacillus asahii]|uniref:SIR2 family NAD-dependent protein deacylase n=1 Tax=Peribacillus asahii TaxID=228899 RepID=UPI00207A9112|nr:SIR2 family protein [Peribacillus asahii]USK62314.1 SIR2 family protein [Peribacillus asahii]